MRVFALTALTMVAFAANSILTRFAIADRLIDPMGFANIRLMAGAAFLTGLVLLRKGRLRFLDPARLPGVLALATYMLGFSIAYTELDAGVGALILFGSVQITMFGAALIEREPIGPKRWISTLTAAGGLIWLLWPSEQFQISLLYGSLMVMAGFAWGAYSLIGRGSKTPLENTAANFVLAVPIGIFLGLYFPASHTHFPATMAGIGLAVIAGAITSGLGYTLWNAILPHLTATRASVAQLSAPVLAIIAGVLLLGEPLSFKLVVGTVIVLGGVLMAFLDPKT